MKRIILTIAIVISLCAGFIEPAQATLVYDVQVDKIFLNWSPEHWRVSIPSGKCGQLIDGHADFSSTYKADEDAFYATINSNSYIWGFVYPRYKIEGQFYGTARIYEMESNEVFFTNDGGRIRVHGCMNDTPFPIYYNFHNTTTGRSSGWVTESSAGANDASWLDISTNGGYSYNYTVDYKMTSHDSSYYGRSYDVYDNIPSVVLDTQAPSGIMSTPEYSNTENVTITNTNPGNDATSMRFSLNGTNWSTWETYSNTKTYTVPAEGIYTIYVQYKDAMGNVGSSSDTVTVDTVVPTGSLSTASGSNFVNNMVDLITTASDANSVTHMMIALTSDFSGVSWQSYDGVSSIAIPGADGEYTIYAKYKDIAGNVSPVYTANVIKDTIEPTNCSIELQGLEGIQGETSSQSISVIVNGTDPNGIAGITVSNDNSSWSPMCSVIVEGKVQFTNFLLTEGRGTKTVYARVYDTAGNYSLVSDTIIYNEDTTLPTVSISLTSSEGSTIYTTNPEINVKVSAYDNATYQENLQIRFSNDGVTWGSYFAFSSSLTWNLVTGAGGTNTEGTKTVFINCKDESGNVGYANANIIYSSSKPAVNNSELTNNISGCTDANLNVDTIEIDGVEVLLCNSNIAYVPLPLDNSTTQYRVAIMGADFGEWTAFDSNLAQKILIGVEGEVEVKVQGRNANGALSDEFILKFIIDRNSPVVSSFKGKDGATASKTEWVVLQAEVKDDFSNVIFYRARVNSGAWSSINLLGDSGEVSDFSISGLVSGLNKIEVEFSDMNKNAEVKGLNMFRI